MKLRESITIQARPEAVWLFLEDPALMEEWSSKLIAWEPLDGPTSGEGARIRACYRMGRRELWCEQTLSDYEPPTRLTWRMAHPDNDRLEGTSLSFTLKSTRRGIHLTQTIELPDRMIPWYLRWLIRFIMATGHPQGERYLHRLKRLVEELEATS